MAIGDMPKFQNLGASSSSYSAGALGVGSGTGMQMLGGGNLNWHEADATASDTGVWKQNIIAAQALIGATQDRRVTVSKPQIDSKTTKLRVVRVFLVDPDDRLPVDKRILYKSDEMITDATDQELFFGIDVKNLIDAHNKMRAKTEWEHRGKSKTGLKEIRIRDLVMSVTTLAEFTGRAYDAEPSGD